MKRLILLGAAFCGLTLAQAQTNFQANLDGLQEVPPNASPAFGVGDFNLSGTTLSVTAGSYQDLLGGATAVTLNNAGPGTNGSIVFALTLDTPGAATGTFSGSGTLSAAQITELQAGSFYVNIRSAVFPSGEIRGQLFAEVPEPTTLALVGFGTAVLLVVRKRNA